MDIRAAEISTILKDQIANFGSEAEIAEVESRIEVIYSEMAQEEALRDGGVMKGLSDELGTVQQALEPLYNHLEEAIELN